MVQDRGPGSLARRDKWVCMHLVHVGHGRDSPCIRDPPPFYHENDEMTLPLLQSPAWIIRRTRLAPYGILTYCPRT